MKADIPDIHNNLGHALAALGRPTAASAAFARAIELKPVYPEALCNWGLALAELDRFDEAESKYRQAITANPRFAGAYNNLGLLLKATGRLTEAQLAFEQAIELSPRDFSLYDNLAAIKPFIRDDPNLAALESAADQPDGLSVADQTHLHFALAKAHDGLSRPEYAFAHLDQGQLAEASANQLRRGGDAKPDGPTAKVDQPRLYSRTSRLRRAVRGSGLSSSA